MNRRSRKRIQNIRSAHKPEAARNAETGVYREKGGETGCKKVPWQGSLEKTILSSNGGGHVRKIVCKKCPA